MPGSPAIRRERADALPHRPEAALECAPDGDVIAANVLALPITDSLSDGLVLVREGRIAAVNDALCRVTGFTRDELVGSAPRAEPRGVPRPPPGRRRLRPRDRRPLTLALLDLDHFKAINDRHGDPVGDRVLVETANRLRGMTRAGDHLARVGGEELAWLLSRSDGESAELAAERARRAVAASVMAGFDGVTIPVGLCARGRRRPLRALPPRRRRALRRQGARAQPLRPPRSAPAGPSRRRPRPARLPCTAWTSASSTTASASWASRASARGRCGRGPRAAPAPTTR